MKSYFALSIVRSIKVIYRMTLSGIKWTYAIVLLVKWTKISLSRSVTIALWARYDWRRMIALPLAKRQTAFVHCGVYRRPEAATGPYHADSWIGSNASVPWYSRPPNLTPTSSYIGPTEGHTLMLKIQNAGWACACNSGGCGKNTIQAELVSLQEILSVTGIMYELKLTVSNLENYWEYFPVNINL